MKCGQDGLCKHGFARRREMNGAVGELSGWEHVPGVEIIPTFRIRTDFELVAICIVCPTRIEEIIADVTISSSTYKDRLIYQHDRRGAMGDARGEHIVR